MCGTPVGDAILRAHERGAVVAGTSAGASIQSSHMVAFGVGGATPKQRMTQVAAGLGLVDSTVIDQHFDQRNRYGRLLMIVAQSPQLLGIGVDEDTCGLVEDVDGDLVMRVPRQGRGHDLRRRADGLQRLRGQALLPAARQRRGLPRAARGRGLQPDHARCSCRRSRSIDPEDADELAEASRDLRQLARDIAAADATPAAIRRRLALRRTRDPAPTPPRPMETIA